MENRQEIKEGVKNKLIEKLADQIAQESDFEQLKNELALELFKLKEDIIPPIIEPETNQEEKKEEPIKREFDKNDGIIPINIEEEIYKELNGFVFDPKPIETRFENGVDKLQGRNGPFGTVSLIENIELAKSGLDKSPIKSSPSEIAERIASLRRTETITGEIEALEKLYKFKDEIYNIDPYKNMSLKEELKPVNQFDSIEKQTQETDVYKDMSSGMTFTSFLSNEPEKPKETKQAKVKKTKVKAKAKAKKTTIKKKRG